MQLCIIILLQAYFLIYCLRKITEKTPICIQVEGWKMDNWIKRTLWRLDLFMIFPPTVVPRILTPLRKSDFVSDWLKFNREWVEALHRLLFRSSIMVWGELNKWGVNKKSSFPFTRPFAFHARILPYSVIFHDRSEWHECCFLSQLSWI